MSDTICPFCGLDPFEYVDVGVGVPMPVAVTCCGLGDAYFRGQRPAPEDVTLTWEEFRDIGHKLAEQQRAARPAAVPAEAIRALAERYKSEEAFQREGESESCRGYAEALEMVQADLLRLMGEGDG